MESTQDEQNDNETQVKSICVFVMEKPLNYITIITLNQFYCYMRNIHQF